MPDIVHRPRIRSSVGAAHRALATLQGIAGSWATETGKGSPSPDDAHMSIHSD